MRSLTNMKNLFAVLLILMISSFILSSCQAITTSDSHDTSNYISTQDSQFTPQVTSEDTPDSSITPTVKVISPDTAKAMMDKGGVIVVDVRRADEYAEGHIESALLVPNETIEAEATTALPDKNAVYLIYCRSGRRSNEAAHKLIALGYQHVYDFGGILSWEYGIIVE